MVVLWRWLVTTGRSRWLTLAYAWNPLVVFEIAHSGHIDALGALWMVASAFWLARRRTQLASVAFVLASRPSSCRSSWRRSTSAGCASATSASAPSVSSRSTCLSCRARTSRLGLCRTSSIASASMGPCSPRSRLSPRPALPQPWPLSPASPLRPWHDGGSRRPIRRRGRGQWPPPLTFAPVIYPWYLLYDHTFPVHRHDAAPDGVDR